MSSSKRFSLRRSRGHGPRATGPDRFKDIFAELPSETQELLNSRYGVSSHGYWRYLALALLALGLPWLMWSAWYHSNPESRVTLVSFTPIDDRSIEITFDLDRRDSGLAHSCTLIARDYEKNVVGEITKAVQPQRRKIIGTENALSNFGLEFNRTRSV